MIEGNDDHKLYQKIIGVIRAAVVEGDIEPEHVLPAARHALEWADGFVTAKLNKVPA